MKETGEEIVKQAASRDARCAMALRVQNLFELNSAFSSADYAHFYVTLIGDSAKCKSCISHVCRCLRDHFQSTTNSKRRVSTYLFWKNKLGLSFPVSDDMLERHVWQNLGSCEFGIKQGNGQRKKRGGPVCVNPYHYYVAKVFEILKPLASTLHLLGYTSDGYISKTLEGLGWDGKEFASQDESLGASAFQIISARVRQMEDEKFSASNVQASSTLQAPVNPYTPSGSPANGPTPDYPTFPTQQPPSPYQAPPTPGTPYQGPASPPLTPEYSPQVCPTDFNPDVPPEYVKPESDRIVPSEYTLEQALSDVDMEIGNLYQSGKLMQPSEVSKVLVQSVQQNQFSPTDQNELEALESYLQQSGQQIHQPRNSDINALATAQISNEQLEQLLAAELFPTQTQCTGRAQVDERGFVMQYSGLEFHGDWLVPQMQVYGHDTAVEMGTFEKQSGLAESGSKLKTDEQPSASDSRCVVGHFVALQTAEDGSIIAAKANIDNYQSADFCGILQSSDIKIEHEVKGKDPSVKENEKSDEGKKSSNMVAVMGTGKIRIRGPAVPGDKIFADLKTGDGCGVCIAATANDEKNVIGKVMVTGNGADSYDADREHTVTAVISIPPEFNKNSGGRDASLVKTAKLRMELAKALDANEESNDGDVKGLTNALSKVKVGTLADSGETLRFKKVKSISDGGVFSFFSHESKKALTMPVDGGSNCSGVLNLNSMFLALYENKDKLRLQTVLNDENWLQVTESNVNFLGNPDESESSFQAVEGDGFIAIKHLPSNQYLSSDKDGNVSLSNSLTNNTRFTAYRRIISI
eukprot:m.333920 g.333920  ORF g.333920 m.333920 type:complete len:808 (-) comp17246_c0_seq1:198-2621(-)